MAGSPIQYLQIKLSNGIQKHLITDKVSAFKNSKTMILADKTCDRNKTLQGNHINSATPKLQKVTWLNIDDLNPLKS